MEFLFGLFVVVSLFILLAKTAGTSKNVEDVQSSFRSIRHDIRWLREEISEIKRKMGTTADTSPEEPSDEAESEEPYETPSPIIVQQPATPAQPPVPIIVEPEPEQPQIAAAIPVESKTPQSVLPSEFVEQSNRVAETAREVLSKIWSWLLVGEEHRPKNVSMEYAVASTWLMRAGIIVVIGFVVTFLKWSIAQELMTDLMRVAIIIVAGAGMVVAGTVLSGKRKYVTLGQGLTGGGIAALYYSMYAAGMQYSLVSIPTAFALMALVTLAAGVLSVRTNSMLVAIFGIIGGYSTPVLLRTGTPEFAILYGYLFLLSIGVASIAHYKQWRLLNYLSFFFTYVIALGALHRYDVTAFPVVISYLTLFFVMHSWIGIYHNMLKNNRSTVLEIGHLILNVGIYAVSARWLILDAYGTPFPAILTFALSVFYVFQVYAFIKLKRVDRNLLTALIGMAGLFASVTIPIIWDKESITICFSLLGLMFLWLGFKLGSNFLVNFAYLIYIFIFGRLAILDMPGGYATDPGSYIPIAGYWPMMFDRMWTFGTATASILVAFFLHARGVAKFNTLSITKESNTGSMLGRDRASAVFYWIGIMVLFVYVELEVNVVLGYFQPLRLPMLTVIACIMALYFLWRYIATGKATFIIAMTGFITFIIGKLLIFDIHSWELGRRMLFGVPYTGLYAGMRLMDFGFVMLLLFAGWHFLKGREPGGMRPLLGYGGLAVMFAYLSLELNSGMHFFMRDFRMGAISILWGLLAVCYISGGIWKNLRPLRFIGLAVFALVAGKVFFVDLEHVDGIYRVVALLAVGILLLLGSFAYLYSDGKFNLSALTQRLTEKSEEDE